jgi:diaminopimelate decarboxylase
LETKSQKDATSLIYTDSSLFGMTCDGMDVIAKNINLPIDVKVNDWLVFGGMGSYTVGPRSEFNGMKSLS